MVIANQQIPVLLVKTLQPFDIPLQMRVQAQQDRQSFAPAVHHEVTKCGHGSPHHGNRQQQFNDPGDNDWHRLAVSERSAMQRRALILPENRQINGDLT